MDKPISLTRAKRNTKKTIVEDDDGDDDDEDASVQLDTDEEVSPVATKKTKDKPNQGKGKEKGVDAKPAWVPMGQQQLSKNPEGWEKRREEYIADSFKWVNDHPELMSFELWCVHTGYDPTATDGGEVFQKMLHFMLVTGTGAEFTKHGLADSYYSMNDGKKGNKWDNANDPYSGRGLGGKGGSGANKILHSPKTQGLHKSRGGPVGHFSNAAHGFRFPGALAMLTAVARQPGSKLNWLQTLNTKSSSMLDNKGKSSQGTEQQFASDANKKDKGCSELAGCMAIANTSAAIFGLYFYPGCMLAENNWTVTQTMDGVRYDVRMRMWNPNYQMIDGSKLLVQEPLNPKARWEFEDEALKELGKKRVVGGISKTGKTSAHLGFFLPDIFQETRPKSNGRKFPMEPAFLIRDRVDKARIAPFFGKPPMTDSLAPLNSCTYLATILSGQVSAPQNEVYFGFNVPKAHWLYPMYTLDRSEISEKGTSVSKHKSTAEVYGAATAFQSWPRLKAIYTTQQQRKQELEKESKDRLVKKLHQLFVIEDIEGVDGMSAADRRAHALGSLAAAGSSTLPASSTMDETDDMDVDEVILPQAPAAPPVSTGTGEQSFVPDPMETNMETTGDSESSAAQQGDLAQDIGFVADAELGVMSRQSMIEEETGDANLGIETDSQLQKKFNELAGFPPNTKYVQGFKAGEEVRTKTDLNEHWRTVRQQPWPHRDIYDVSGIDIVAEEVEGQQQLDAYKQKYGSTFNLYLRGETVPKKIKDIKVQYGLAKDNTLHEKITKDSAMFRRNLCKILAIYYYPDEIGKKHKKISHADKQKGMLQGIYSKHTQGTQMCGEKETLDISYGKRKGYTMLWPPVFKEAPPQTWADEFDFDFIAGQNEQHHDRVIECNVDKMARLKSDMTVLQWVTSPWHYAFLPYQPCTAVFKDGETYSEGCVRCSRPFYEFKYMYAWYRLSVPKTQHWVNGYWMLNPKANKCGKACAPKPFHYDEFWSADQVRSNDKTAKRDAETQHLQVDEDGGWHNWPTKEFQLKSDSKYLSCEFYKREASLNKSKVNQVIMQKDVHVTFREYNNHVYDEQRRDDYWSGKYPTYPQGRLSTGKVLFGQRDYMLMRSSKYGNTCKDCASVLMLAPGLYQRNHRTVFETGMVEKKKKKKGEEEEEERRKRRKEKKNMRTGAAWTRYVPNGDASYLHAQQDSEDEEEGEDGELAQRRDNIRAQWAIYAKVLRTHVEWTLGDITKLKEAPDIYVQKQVPGPWTDGYTPEVDHEMIQRAIRDLGDMLSKPQAQWTLDTTNPAFKSIVQQMQLKYVHKDRFKRDPTTKVFDSEMMRMETRNAKVKYRNKWYYNCLQTKVYQPTQGLDKPVDRVKDYKTTTYYATRFGAPGDVECDTPIPTMWCGDGYVTEFDETATKAPFWVKGDNLTNNPVKQLRKMRQSRLFITYSLHRAVTSEEEARLIMQKMHDAAQQLFGNDLYISQLLVFGYKLSSFSDRAEGTDLLSTTKFEVIAKPNKKDATPTFYGEQGASSYTYDTYETHVDSIEVDGGIEIGPQRHHPHFHILLTVNHWSYVQIDYFKMNTYLEMMFRGIDPGGVHGWGTQYQLKDASGGLFYTDNENPYVDIRLYPQDNWNEVIAAYVRKNATPGIMESLGVRSGGT